MSTRVVVRAYAPRRDTNDYNAPVITHDVVAHGAMITPKIWLVTMGDTDYEIPARYIQVDATQDFKRTPSNKRGKRHRKSVR